jgi:hypothetical protein
MERTTLKNIDIVCPNYIKNNFILIIVTLCITTTQMHPKREINNTTRIIRYE